jgi:hypothetical protein
MWRGELDPHAEREWKGEGNRIVGNSTYVWRGDKRGRRNQRIGNTFARI